MGCRIAFVAIVISSSVVVACGSSDSSGGSKTDGGSGTGGTAGSGGSAGGAGATGGSGGAAGGSAGSSGAAGASGTGGTSGAGGSSGSGGSAGAPACGALATPDCQTCIGTSCSTEFSSCSGNAKCKPLSEPFAACVCNSQLGLGTLQKCIDDFETGGGKPATDTVTCLQSKCSTPCGV